MFRHKLRERIAYLARHHRVDRKDDRILFANKGEAAVVVNGCRYGGYRRSRPANRGAAQYADKRAGKLRTTVPVPPSDSSQRRSRLDIATRERELCQTD